MKIRQLIPYMVISYAWGVFSGQGESMVYAYAAGMALGLVFIPWGVSSMFIRDQTPDLNRKRYRAFIILWGILIFIQVFVYFGEAK